MLKEQTAPSNTDGCHRALLELQASDGNEDNFRFVRRKRRNKQVFSSGRKKKKKFEGPTVGCRNR